MALNKATLASDLEDAIKAIANDDDVRQKMAEAIANNVIDHLVANGVVTVASGITVQVDPTTGIGATTGTGSGSIS